MSEQDMIEITELQNIELVPWPLEKDQIVAGNPEPRGCVIGRSADKRNFSGVWECTPGKFTWNHTWDETVHITQGRVTIQEEGGAAHEFKAGDVVYFHVGLRSTWTVHEKVRKFYALFSPEPLDL